MQSLSLSILHSRSSGLTISDTQDQRSGGREHLVSFWIQGDFRSTPNLGSPKDLLGGSEKKSTLRGAYRFLVCKGTMNIVVRIDFF